MKRMYRWGAMAIMAGLALSGCGQTPKPHLTIPRETRDYKIYFSSNRTGERELFRMDPDGEHQIRLTNSSGSKYFAVVTLDGSRVVYVDNDHGKRDI